jgi:hypothetical protein
VQIKNLLFENGFCYFITLAVVLYVDWYNYLSKIIEKETILYNIIINMVYYGIFGDERYEKTP